MEKNDKTINLLAVGTSFEILRIHRGCAEVALSGPHGGGIDESLVVNDKGKVYRDDTENEYTHYSFRVTKHEHVKNRPTEHKKKRLTDT